VSKTLRIALILEKFDPLRGGLESWTHQYASWLLDQGHGITVVTFGADTVLPVDIQCLPWSPRPLLRARRIAECVAALEVDIVHDMGDGLEADVFHPQTSSRISSLERDLKGRAWWQRVAFFISPRCRRWKRETLAVENQLMRSARHLVAPSELVKSDFSARYDPGAVAVSVIPNGVNTERFLSPCKPRWRESWRARLGLSDETLFLLVANNFQLKGLDAALKAIKEIREKGAVAHLAVAGEGDIKKYALKTKRMGLADRVSFLGRQERMEEVFAAADVSLQPSLHDACSLSTLEGLASGLPTITTRLNGASSFVVPGVHGFLIDRATDIEALVEAMTSLLDADKRNAMSRQIGQLREALELHSRFEAFLALYRQLLDEAGPS